MKRIFIVDDSKEIRKRLIALLDETQEVEVVGQAATAEEALPAIDTLRPDTLLLDIRLPGKSGMALLPEVKQLYPDMRVIIMSTSDSPHYRRQSLNAGAQHFFNKTRETQALIDALKSDEPQASQKGPHLLRKELNMKTFKKILVVSRSTRHCRNVLQLGISLARQYGAHLYVMHVIHDPFNLEGWNLPVPSLELEYQKMVADANEDLERMLQEERKNGLPITVWVRDGRPDKEIANAVKEEKIDLIVMLAHEEGRLEHFLFGKTNDALIRQLPASIMLVKKEEE